MTKVLILGTALAIGLSAASVAGAATLTATTTYPNESFSIEFDDLNGNSLFDINELVSLTPFAGTSTTMTAVLAVPEIANISVAGTVPGAIIGGSPGLWYFDSNDDNIWNQGSSRFIWTYEISGLSQIPLPAGLPLALAGFGLLWAVGRRKNT